MINKHSISTFLYEQVNSDTQYQQENRLFLHLGEITVQENTITGMVEEQDSEKEYTCEGVISQTTEYRFKLFNKKFFERKQQHVDLIIYSPFTEESYLVSVQKNKRLSAYANQNQGIDGIYEGILKTLPSTDVCEELTYAKEQHGQEHGLRFALRYLNMSTSLNRFIEITIQKQSTDEDDDDQDNFSPQQPGPTPTLETLLC